MNILILNWRDINHPLSGGAEISLLEHAKYWKKKNANVTWFTSMYKNAKSSEENDGIKYIRKGSQYTVHMYAFLTFIKNGFKETDIVIDNFHGIPFFTPFYLKQSKIVALINEPAKEVWFKNLIWPLSLIAYIGEPFAFKLYKNINFITSADSIKSELIKLGIKKKFITIIEHGITVEKTKLKVKKEANPTIMYLSQLSPDKGIEDALDAFKLVQNNNKNAKFWVVGKAISQKYEEKIKEKVLKEKIKNVKLFGYVNKSKKYDLLKKSWVLVHPSIREGWGLNVIEANSYGVPAIGYNVTGLRDSIKDGVTGILTAKNNAENLAENMNRILFDKVLYKKLSKNAVTWADSFSWENAGNKSMKLLQDVMKK